MTLLALLHYAATTVEARPPKTDKRNKKGQESEANTPVDRPYSVAVRPLLANGRVQPSAYLTLWRELEDGEQVPANFLDPNGLGFYAPVIWDDTEHQTRWIREQSATPNDGRHGREEDRFQFTELRRGKYRVTAISYRGRNEVPDPTPYGVSAPFTLERDTSRQPPPSIEILMTGSRRLLVRTIDAESREPINGLAIRLRNASDMPIVLGSGSGNFFERTSETGEVLYGQLLPGGFTVEVLGKYAEPNHFVQYEPMAERTKAEVTVDSETVLEIAVTPRHLNAEEIQRRFPFYVYGRVTDESGAPLDRVTVSAATGSGTLFGAGNVRTAADGSYRLYFHAGMRQGIYAALISAAKEDWYETSLNRQGNLLMSDGDPKEFEKLFNQDAKAENKTSVERVVFPNLPREVNFELAKAAAIEGTLVDQNGDALIGQQIILFGNELPPGSSVLCSIQTDRNGKFRFADVPTHRFWRFRLPVGATRDEVSSKPFVLQNAGLQHCDVVLNSHLSDKKSVTFKLSNRAGVEE